MGEHSLDRPASGQVVLYTVITDSSYLQAQQQCMRRKPETSNVPFGITFVGFVKPNIAENVSVSSVE